MYAPNPNIYIKHVVFYSLIKVIRIPIQNIQPIPQINQANPGVVIALAIIFLYFIAGTDGQATLVYIHVENGWKLGITQVAVAKNIFR